MARKNALLVFHINFLRQDRGCCNYIYKIAKLLKEQGFNLDFFSTNLFENMEDDFGAWNQKEKLIDNFYFLNTKDALYPDSWCNQEICERFNQIINQKHYDYINIHYIQWADLIRYADIPDDTTVIYTMHDSQFMQTNYNHCDKKIGQELDYELRDLQLFDKIMCISHDEMLFWQHLLPESELYFIPYFQSFTESRNGKKKYDILFIGACNPYNIEGLKWFLDEVYPRLKQKNKITVVGKIVEEMQYNHPSYYKIMQDANFQLIDFCENLDQLYADVKIAMVPMFRGTGMKIKTIEALAHNTPVISTLLGVDGFPDKTMSGILVTNDAFEFSKYIENLLTDAALYKKVQKQQRKYFEQIFDEKNIEKQILNVFSSRNSAIKRKKQNAIKVIETSEKEQAQQPKVSDSKSVRSKKIKLFNFFPIYKYSQKQHCRKWKLFGIPLITIKDK